MSLLGFVRIGEALPRRDAASAGDAGTPGAAAFADAVQDVLLGDAPTSAPSPEASPDMTGEEEIPAVADASAGIVAAPMVIPASAAVPTTITASPAETQPMETGAPTGAETTVPGDGLSAEPLAGAEATAEDSLLRGTTAPVSTSTPASAQAQAQASPAPAPAGSPAQTPNGTATVPPATASAEPTPVRPLTAPHRSETTMPDRTAARTPSSAGAEPPIAAPTNAPTTAPPTAAPSTAAALPADLADTAVRSDIPVAAPVSPGTPLSAVRSEPTTPASRPALLPQISAPVVALTQAPEGEHRLTLTVSPENLGPVTVRAHIVGGAIHVELDAPTDIGREALRALLVDLRRDLAAAAPQASLAVSTHDSPTASTSSGQQGPSSGASPGQHQSPPSPGSARAAHRSPAPSPSDPPSPLPAPPHGGIDVYA